MGGRGNSFTCIDPLLLPVQLVANSKEVGNKNKFDVLTKFV